ncbi:predicted coding region AF_0064 [Archaeoglobus fulgidus DSM 4304]|uniref:Uncharacterized protein AF_0064 n=1 Tax=Archaeoglobus fulgidus (strain ATCC 49558 / DSM 4304 / JCM 9628 / NBRC 100126 / VC-16) TaxID=224325 RepID=Y064_ARCFU|nr:RecName: Full=Uncharacterized protein AF_0064 [Archaeoglobus fulgidus DSM 4304]AAB91171.1 predicted coding region AF_0064 [Archaeoglobus fulgidus DSM 4304]
MIDELLCLNNLVISVESNKNLRNDDCGNSASIIPSSMASRIFSQYSAFFSVFYGDENVCVGTDSWSLTHSITLFVPLISEPPLEFYTFFSNGLTRLQNVLQSFSAYLDEDLSTLNSENNFHRWQWLSLQKSIPSILSSYCYQKILVNQSKQRSNITSANPHPLNPIHPVKVGILRDYHTHPMSPHARKMQRVRGFEVVSKHELLHEVVILSFNRNNPEKA